MFLPSPTFHWYPTLAALAAHKTPFQKGEVPTEEQEKILGSLTLYLWSIIWFQSLLSSK
jgi:hypothetical protein